jgi:Mn2+/Fe2+ NRAMP family transporter
MDSDFFRVVAAVLLIIAIIRYPIITGVAGMGIGAYMIFAADAFWGIVILLFGIFSTSKVGRNKTPS